MITINYINCDRHSRSYNGKQIQGYQGHPKLPTLGDYNDSGPDQGHLHYTSVPCTNLVEDQRPDRIYPCKVTSYVNGSKKNLSSAKSVSDYSK